MPQEHGDSSVTPFAYLAGFIDIVNDAVLSLQCAAGWLEDTGYEPVMTEELYEVFLSNIRQATSFNFPYSNPRTEQIKREYEEGQADGISLMERLVLHIFPMDEKLGKDYVGRLIRWVGMEPLDDDECAALTIGQPLYYVSGRGEDRVEALARVCGNIEGALSVKIMKILYAGTDQPSIRPGTVITKVEEGTLYMRAMTYPLLLPHRLN